MSQKITRFLLTLLILVLGFGQLLRFELFGSVPVYLHDILVFTILALNLKKLNFHSLGSGLRLFLLGLGLSSIVALTLYAPASLLLPSLYSLRLLAYLALYQVVRDSSTSIPPLAFLLSGTTTALLGLAQYYYMPDMRWAQYLGWDDHLYRLVLPHYDPTYTGVMLSLFVLSLPRSRQFAPYYALPILAILLTQARSVWLTLGIVGLFYAFKFRAWGKLVACCLIFGLYLLLRPIHFGEGNNLLRTYSITSRFSSDLAYLQKYNWTLLTGRGLNTLILAQVNSSLPNHATGPNNSYLYLLVTTGVLGLVGWGIMMRDLYVQSNIQPQLLFFFIASLFNNVMFYPFALLWVLLAASRNSH